MAQLDQRPFPPGHFPVVVVGSGPGGLQVGYFLKRLGIDHAIVSSDPAPGGMFRRFPIFQRLISWTKRSPLTEAEPLAGGIYDWNSLLAEESSLADIMSAYPNPDTYFPSRPQMEEGLVAFADKAPVEVRYGCRWESTERTDDGFVLVTSDGEYRCKVLVFALGMTEAWKPPGIPGLGSVPHYVDTGSRESYANQMVFIIGKRNSGMELADGLLPWVKQLIVASPSPLRTSISSHSVGAARVRYLQPYEDHVFGGGNFVLDAAIARIERNGSGFCVQTEGTTKPGSLTFEVDAVIAATGFTTPLQDLPALGVDTFNQDRMPAQTAFWESPSVPGIFFAGSITQGAAGLMKYGIASSSGAVHGFRHNARVLAQHIAEAHFGQKRKRIPIPRDEVGPFLLARATRSSALWNQKSYLAHTVAFDRDGGAFDEGLVPLSHFVDEPGPDSVAVTVETNAGGDIYPAVYVRRQGRVSEHLLDEDPLLNFSGSRHLASMEAVLRGSRPD